MKQQISHETALTDDGGCEMEQLDELLEGEK
jgi:hypothetical protein